MAPANPALFVEVWDATTGEPISEGSGLAVIDDVPHPLTFEYRNTLTIFGSRGVYDLSLVSPGYQPWYMAKVVVTGTRCGVNTRYVRADLQPKTDSIGTQASEAILRLFP